MNKLLYIEIYKEIEDKIISGELNEGTKILSERELAKHYKVSRNVIREAIKVLKEKDYVEIRIGKGVYVKKPNVSIVADSLKRVINTEIDGISKILEVREILELSIIKKAVETASNEDIERLEALYFKMEQFKEDVDKFVEMDSLFHLELAKTIPNEVFYILCKSFSDLSNKVIYLTKYNPTSIHLAQKQHFNIIQALKMRDKKLAVKVIMAHLNAAKRDLEMMKEKS